MKNLVITSYTGKRIKDVSKLIKISKELLECNGETKLKRTERKRTTSHFKYKLSRRSEKNVNKRRKLEKTREYYRRPYYIFEKRSGDKNIYRMATHFYNCKRMKMIKTWGCSVPRCHSNRGVKSIYKILCNHASLEDVSYFRPVSIEGISCKNILDILSKYMNPNHKLLHDAEFISGKIEYQVLLYSCESYPNKLLGPSILSFNPSPNNVIDVNDENDLLIWIHSSFYPEISASLYDELSLYDGCIFNELDKKFSRFSLRGARSLDILSKIICSSSSSSSSSSNNHENNSDDNVNTDKNIEFFNNLKDYNDILYKIWPNGHTLPLLIDDVRNLRFQPEKDSLKKKNNHKQRLKFPTSMSNFIDWKENFNGPKKTPECSLQLKNTTFKGSWTKSLSISDNSSRDKWTHPSEVINETSEHENSDKLAILCIYKNCRNFPLKFCKFNKHLDKKLNGFDIVVPRIWASSVWKALHFSGARLIGLEERKQFDLECGVPNFPDDFIDCEIGKEHWIHKHNEENKLNKILSSAKKKHNSNVFENLKLIFPQNSNNDNKDNIDNDNDNDNDNNLSELFPSPETTDFLVVRESEYISAFFPPLSKYQRNKIIKLGFIKGRLNLCENFQYHSMPYDEQINTNEKYIPSSSIPELPLLSRNTALMVLLKNIGKGVPKHGALLYSLSRSDYLLYLTHSLMKRKIKRLDGRRVASHNGITFDPDNISHDGLIDTDTNSCIGMLTNGNTSHLSGSHIGIGLCSAETLYKVLRNAAIILPEVLGEYFESHPEHAGKNSNLLEEMLQLVYYKNNSSGKFYIASFVPLVYPS